MVNGDSPFREVRRRFTLVRPVVHQLRTRLFRHHSVPSDVKRVVFQAYVLPKLLHGSAAWQRMNLQTLAYWNRNFVMLCQQFFFVGQRGPGHRSLDFLALARTVSPSLILARHRLSLLDRLLKTPVAPVWALLLCPSNRSSWVSLVQDDLALLFQYVPDSPLASRFECLSFPAFCDELLDFQRPFSRLCKQAGKRFQAYLDLWWSFRCFRRAFGLYLQESGVEVSSTSLTADAVTTSYPCPSCPKAFPTYGALCTHAYRVNQVRNLACRYAVGHRCRSCLRVYRSRDSLVHHLKYMRTGCLLHLILSVSPLDKEELAAIEETEAEARRAQRFAIRRRSVRMPVLQAHGPRRPSIMPSLVGDAQAFSRVQQTFDGELRLPAANAANKTALSARARREALELSLDVVQQLKLYHVHDAAAKLAWPVLDVPPPLREAILVYVFFGHRQKENFYAHAHRFAAETGLAVRVLLIDHFWVSEDNVPDHSKLASLLGMVSSKSVTAMFLSPPDATWCTASTSQASFHILRDEQAGWCGSGLAPPALEKLLIENEALFAALRLFLACLVHGIAVVMQHPARQGGRQARMPSVWKIAYIQWLLQCPGVRLHFLCHRMSVHDIRKGAPTHLLSAWMPLFEEHCRAAQFSSTPEEVRCTERLTESPSDCTRLVAESFLKHYQIQRSSTAEATDHNVVSLQRVTAFANHQVQNSGECLQWDTAASCSP